MASRIRSYLIEMEEMKEGPAAICHWNGMAPYNRETEQYEGRHHFWSWSEGCLWRGVVYQAYSSWVWNDRKDEEHMEDADLSIRPERASFGALSEFMHRVCDIADKHEIKVHTSAGDWFKRFIDSTKGLQFGGKRDKYGQTELLLPSFSESQVVALLKELGFHPYCGSKGENAGYAKDERKVNIGTTLYHPGERAAKGFVAAEDSLFAPGWEASDG